MPVKEKLRLTLRGYQTMNRLVPGLIPLVVLQNVLEAFFPFVGIYMSAQILTALAQQKPLPELLWLVGVTVGLNFLVTLFSTGVFRLWEYRSARLWRVESLPLHQKLQSMDYSRVEDAEIHQKLSHIQIMRQTNGLGLPRLLWSLAGAIQGLSTILFSVAFTTEAFLSLPPEGTALGSWGFLLSPWFTVLMVLLVLGNICLDVWRSTTSAQKGAKAMSAFQMGNRFGSYYFEYLFNYQAGKDLKLYGMQNIIRGQFGWIIDMLDSVTKKFQRISSLYDCLGAVTSTLFSGLVYCYVALKALFGCFSVGGIVQYAGSLSKLGGGITTLMECVSMLLFNAEALQELFDFIDMPDEQRNGNLSVEKRADNEYEIAFRDVSFRYPGTETDVLKNLNLEFRIGKRMAVVGMNGSGKTTMIKLLCRLYDPTEGMITLNGIDIRKYDYQEYMGIFSVVFQDFKLFSYSLGQNVAASVEYDGERVKRCLQKAGFGEERLKRMEKGLETALYKDFEEDGVEISGGEAQKIALARALYKNAPFIILDEPTAALDPVAEFEIYSKFNEIVDDKTTVYISHRLSSCRFCDDIVVFDEGRMVQRGCHETLIADITGKYYSLWNAQAQYYTE